MARPRYTTRRDKSKYIFAKDPNPIVHINKLRGDELRIFRAFLDNYAGKRARDFTYKDFENTFFLGAKGTISILSELESRGLITKINLPKSFDKAHELIEELHLIHNSYYDVSLEVMKKREECISAVNDRLFSLRSVMDYKNSF